MYCQNCGAQNNDNSKFCSKCGAPFAQPQQAPYPPMQAPYAPPQGAYMPPQGSYTPPQMPEMPPQGSYTPQAEPAFAQNVPHGEPIPPTSQKKPSSPKKKKLLIGVLCAVLVLAIAGAWFAMQYFSPEQKLLRALEAKDYELALEIFEEDLDSKPSADIDKALLDSAEDIKSAAEEDGDTEAALADLELLEQMADEDARQELSETLRYLRELDYSRFCFEQAEDYMETGNYAAAIDSYGNVLETDSNYDRAMTQRENAVESYRVQVLQEASYYAATGSYALALHEVEQGLNLMPGDEALTQTLQSMQSTVRESALSLAQMYADTEMYEEAIDELDKGLDLLSGDKILLETKALYEEELAKAAEMEPVTLRFWQAGGDYVGAASIMRLLLDKFELMYPWITVDYQAIPWSMDPQTQFQTAIAGGDCADVLVMGPPLDFQLAGEGQLLALDDLLDPSVMEDLYSGLISSSTYRGSENPDMYGKLMSLPLYSGNRVLMYNKEIFDFFGAPYPTEQMSHAELLELAREVTGTMNGVPVYGFGTRATTSEQYLNFVWNYGAKIVDPATMTPGTDSPEWKQGIRDYLAFYEAGVTPPGAAAMSGMDLFNLFADGGCAMFIGAVDYALTLQSEGWSDDKLGIGSLPGETYATSYAGSDVIAVPALTEHVEEAALLLNYLLSTEAQAIYCKNVGLFPSVRSAAEHSFFADDPIQAGFAAAMEGAHFFDNYGVPGVGTILKEEIQRLIAGECDIDTYQANVTARINEQIANMYSW